MKKSLLGALGLLVLVSASLLGALPAQAKFWLQNSSSYTITEVYVINHDGSWTDNYLRSGGYFVPDDGGDIPKTARHGCYYDIFVRDSDGYEATIYSQNLCGYHEIDVTDYDFEGDY